MKGFDGSLSDVVNSGAQWLHGKQNLLHDIAFKYKLLHEKWSEEAQGTYFLSDGRQIDDYFVKKVDFKVGQILEECEEFTENLMNGESGECYPDSVGTFLIEHFKKYAESLPTENERKLALKLLDYHIRFHIIDNSTLSLKDVSAKDWGTYSFNGESCQAHINFKNSFQDLVAIVADQLKDQIRYEKVVDQICWGTSSQAPVAKVLIRCRDGSVYQANQVIVTFSLGVLKERPELFHPALPESHLNAIEKFGFGTINKVFIQFESSWWKELEGIQIVFDDELQDDAHWTRFISGFDVLSPGAPNTLLAWVGGQGALKMEQLSDEVIIEDCLKLLRSFTRMTVSEPKAFHV